MRNFKNPSDGCGHKRFSLEAGTIYWQIFSEGELVGYVTRSKTGRPYYYEAFTLADRSLGIDFGLYNARKLLDNQLVSV